MPGWLQFLEHMQTTHGYTHAEILQIPKYCVFVVDDPTSFREADRSADNRNLNGFNKTDVANLSVREQNMLRNTEFCVARLRPQMDTDGLVQTLQSVEADGTQN